MGQRSFRLAIVIAALAGGVGCQSTPNPPFPPSGASPDAEASPPPSPSPTPRSPLAYIDGKAVTRGDLWTPLVEAAGQEVLSDLVLDRAVTDRLKRRGLTLSDDRIKAQRRRVLDSLGATDEDRAALLLDALRRRRGLGERRFADLLRRNAGLSLLVQRDIHLSEAAIRQAYEQRYGPKYLARLIVTDTLAQARELRKQATAGKSFTDLAAAHSTDPTAARGGLMPPISPADAGYPQVIRDALVKLNPGQVSGVVALEQGYGVLKLERKIKPRAVELDDVKKALAHDVRVRLERMRMRQLAQTMLDEANVVVLDPTLNRAWKAQTTPAPGLAPGTPER